MKQSEQEKKFIQETKAVLKSKNEKNIYSKLQELRVTGNVSVLPFMLELLETSNSQIITQEILNIIKDLRDQKCVPVIVEYIEKNKDRNHIGDIISSCWQSRLDFHSYLEIFATCFLHGDYQVALEAFTVIEEMLWKSSEEQIMSCRKVLQKNAGKVSELKQPLYKELIKVLEEGRSKNSETYPDLYE